MGMDAHPGGMRSYEIRPPSSMLTRPAWKMVEAYLHERHRIKVTVASVSLEIDR
jgi:hypothetical protein